jgi:hypothetical protein
MSDEKIAAIFASAVIVAFTAGFFLAVWLT